MSIQTVKVTINGSDYTLTNSSGNNWTATLTAPGQTSYNLPNHVYEVTATATNSAGTTGTAATTLRVKETVAPVISVISPTGGAYVTNNQQPVMFAVVDEANGSGIDLSNLVVKLDGSAVASSCISTTAITNGYQVTYTPATAMADGQHTVTIDAKDYDGNSATQKSTTFTVDTVPPSLNVTSPTDSSTTATATCVVAGTTNDVTSSSVTVEVKLNGVSQGNATVSAGAFSKSITLADGSNTIVITATDAAGKTSEVTRTVTLDTAVPTISSVTIAPNPVDAGETMIVTVVVE